jgi:O-antigen ligase
VSLYAWLRWFLYVLVSLYVSANFDWKKDFHFLAKIFCYWLIFLGLLGTLQFIKQGAVFQNYLILGEQPYSRATPLIDKENIFGTARVPAYGLFRHPNIFGGLVSLFLLTVLYAFRTKYIGKKLFYPAGIFGCIALLLTFSYFSWLAFLLGILILLFENKPLLKKITLTFTALLVIFSFFIHLVHFVEPLASDPSVYKRMDLLKAGYEMVRSTYYIFGVGLNASTLFIERYTFPTKFIRFVQPPHNIFILLLCEVGLVALLLFIYLLYLSMSKAYYTRYFMFVLFVQIILMGCFDHYFLTIHQPFLLFWLLLGMANGIKR